MNPLVILPLLAAACLAAPAPQGVFLSGPATLVQHSVPVQVPLTKTVHFDVKNVVTGFSTSILKPALAAPQVGIVPQLAAPAPGQNLFTTFQLPSPPELPGSGGEQNPINNIPGAPGGPPAPQPDANNPPQIPGQQPPPQIPGFPEFPQIPGQSTTAKPDAQSPNDPGNGETQNPVLIPGFPALPSFPSTNFQNVPLNIAAPVAVQVPAPVQQEIVEVPQSDDTDTITVEARSAVLEAAPAPAIATVQVAPQPLAAIPAIPAGPTRIEPFRPTPPFDQIVTKQAVLAPGRTHTQITPQVTQIQPEVTVRRVIQDVPVATPVIAQAQPLALAAAPAPALTQFVSGPSALNFATHPVQFNGFNVAF